jgi:hypothetical protein
VKVLGTSAGAFRGTAPPNGSAAIEPLFDFGPKPKTGPFRSEVDDRAGHVGVLDEVLADGVAMREAEQSSDVVGVD